MLKLTSLAIGLFTAILTIPASQVMAANTNTPAIQQPSADLHAQIIIVKIGSQGRGRGYYSNWEGRSRARYHRARWGSGYPRYRHYRGYYRNYHRGYYRDHYRGYYRDHHRGYRYYH
jgi:hypothetical protein